MFISDFGIVPKVWYFDFVFHVTYCYDPFVEFNYIPDVLPPLKSEIKYDFTLD